MDAAQSENGRRARSARSNRSGRRPRRRRRVAGFAAPVFHQFHRLAPVLRSVHGRLSCRAGIDHAVDQALFVAQGGRRAGAGLRRSGHGRHLGRPAGPDGSETAQADAHAMSQGKNSGRADRGRDGQHRRKRRRSAKGNPRHARRLSRSGTGLQRSRRRRLGRIHRVDHAQGL